MSRFLEIFSERRKHILGLGKFSGVSKTPSPSLAWLFFVSGMSYGSVMPTDCLNRRGLSTQWEKMRRKARSLYCMQLQNPRGRNTSFIGSDAYIACWSSANGICKLAVFRQGLGCLGQGSLRGKQRIYKLLVHHDSLGGGIEIALYGLSSVIRAPCI